MDKKNRLVDPDLMYHKPVLENEAVAYLVVQENRWYIDATAGGGGHTARILSQGGRVLAIDQDPDAIEYLTVKFESEIKSGHAIIKKSNFSEIETIVKEIHLSHIKGILFDLGMSTHQVKKSNRGFSFLRNEALDMRMSGTGITASEIVNNYSKDQLYEVFRNYGEEQLADTYAESIVRARAVKPISSTFELLEALRLTNSRGKIHPATKVFQALRIKVNDELELIRYTLPKLLTLLSSGGRIVVISFHSLEDRVIKTFIREEEKKGTIRNLTKRPLHPTEEEISQNRASRSAKMRVCEKI